MPPLINRIMSTNDPLIIAHRGESHDAPENTLASVNLAWERGATAVEVDVHATGDNQIAVIHDSSTLRTTGQKHIVAKTPLSDLQKLDAGSWKGPQWADERIPSLPEILATVPPEGKILVEIKSGQHLLEPLRQTAQESGLRPDQIEIISFSLDTLTAAKRAMPQYKMMWVIRSYPLWRQYIRGVHPKALLMKLGRFGITGVTIGDSRHLNRIFVHHLKAAGRPVYVWTINDPLRAAALLKYGIDGITTDRAAWLKEKLVRAQAAFIANAK